jgi:L-alanine-DL-glutamate epimerase-like enolase superfamily enzyme
MNTQAGMQAAHSGGCTHARRICKHARTHAHMPIVYVASLCIYTSYVHAHMQRISPPPLSTTIAIAPEDVEHPVGRRREAHAKALGGAGAGDGGAGGLEAEEQQ